MKKLTFLAAFIFIASKLPAVELSLEEKLVSNINDFGIDFYQKNQESENICFSPYSLFSCLSMAYLGALDNTALGMQKAMHLDLPQNLIPQAFKNLKNALIANTPTLTIADALWIQENLSLAPSYEDALSEGFTPNITPLCFKHSQESAALINDWVCKATQNNIKTLFNPNSFSEKTQAVLTNVIYFQGDWLKPFSKNKTKKRSFYLEQKKSLSQKAKAPFYTDSPFVFVDMMEQTGYFPYYEDEDLQFLLLPFKSSSYACFFILPRHALKSLEQTLTLKTPHFLASLTSQVEVNVTLPTFKIEGTYDPTTSLKEMGMEDAFSSCANFSLMTPEKSLKIDKISHKTFFSLNEKGVSAAAASGISMGVTCIRPTCNTYFHANHPFLFGIIDLNSNLVLFLGKCTSPQG